MIVSFKKFPVISNWINSSCSFFGGSLATFFVNPETSSCSPGISTLILLLYSFSSESSSFPDISSMVDLLLIPSGGCRVGRSSSGKLSSYITSLDNDSKEYLNVSFSNESILSSIACTTNALSARVSFDELPIKTFSSLTSFSFFALFDMNCSLLTFSLLPSADFCTRESTHL